MDSKKRTVCLTPGELNGDSGRNLFVAFGKSNRETPKEVTGITKRN